MSRLRRQWGVQYQHLFKAQWLEPLWYVDREEAERVRAGYIEASQGIEGFDPAKVSRLVTQVVGDVEVVKP